MKLDFQKRYARHSRMRGFTTLELLIGMALVSIMTAVALPSFTQAYRMYQLNDAANRVAGVLKFTHYEAIRLNVTNAAPLQAKVSQASGRTYLYTDSQNGNVASTDKQAVFPGAVTLVSSSTAPNTGALAGAVGVAAFTNISPTSGSIAFDQRGAVTPAAVSALYIGNTGLPSLGYRAVVVLPTGSIQIWTTDGSGNWHRSS
jgi:Tfp pilus assembly protein FimT